MNAETFVIKIRQSEQTLYRVAKTILKNDTDCEDAVSEAILKAYTKLNTLREDKFFTTWFIRILINECYRMRKKQLNTVDLQTCEESLPASETGYDPGLYEALVALPHKIRMAVTLYYIEGYRVDEIKQILHIPAGTVKSRLARGRYLLKEILESEEVL